MENIIEVLNTFNVGTLVAIFLVNTRRAQKGIQLCKECLIVLNNNALPNGFVNLAHDCLYSTLFKGYLLINDHMSATECYRNLLVVLRRYGNRAKEGKITLELATLYHRQINYKEAEHFYEKALSIMIEIGDKQGQGICYANLGTMSLTLDEYANAETCFEKALNIMIEIGEKQAEGKCYGNLGAVFLHLGVYGKAEEYLQKALVISKEIGDRQEESMDYSKLGAVCASIGEYAKAEEYIQNSLSIRKEIGDRKGESTCYVIQGSVFRSLGQYAMAEEYFQKAVSIKSKIGDRQGTATAYTNLGHLFQSLGEYVKAEEFLKEALNIMKEIEDRKGKAACYGSLGALFISLGEYAKAEEYLYNALAIRKEIGDRRGEASCYGILGTVFRCLGEYAKAEEYIQTALEIRKETGDKDGQAKDYGNLGNVFLFLGEYVKAREYHEKAIIISRETGGIQTEFENHIFLAMDMLLEGNTNEAIRNLFASIKKSEVMLTSLKGNEQFKISFLDGDFVIAYRILSALLCQTGNHLEALCVIELGRARALADLLSAQYPDERQISVDPQSWVGIERIMKKESGCACLYISYLYQDIDLWVVNEKQFLFRRINVNDCLNNNGSVIRREMDDVFSNETFRRFHAVPQDTCEDRSLFPSRFSRPKQNPTEEDRLAALRLLEVEEDENQQPDPTLAEVYKMLVAPVASLIDERELIIVPDRALYKVPFAALSDESGKFLSEIFRIRIVPSLMTLKLIQDSPADYHSTTGALIVGEPKVGQVSYKGRIEELCPLPAARKEAEMIGRLLGAQPLLGEHATKRAVLQDIHSVSLIHFAAHGNAERGEIALAPLLPNNRIPQEEDYLLTMSDISQVRLRAKLVVLSCCHSARGQIRSEGVVGIARAFLGSGARSVLVALWALEDEATEQFMSRFYEHLVSGESASESLHQAMKWMRSNGFSDVGQWAPFMLIGDNVTFDFKN